MCIIFWDNGHREVYNGRCNLSKSYSVIRDHGSFFCFFNNNYWSLLQRFRDTTTHLSIIATFYARPVFNIVSALVRETIHYNNINLVDSESMTPSLWWRDCWAGLLSVNHSSMQRSAVSPHDDSSVNPLAPTVAMGTAIKHPVPDRIKQSFVIFDIRALWRSVLSVRVPGCQKYKWLLNPVWRRMLYSCTCMATVGVKGLNAWSIQCGWSTVSWLH